MSTHNDERLLDFAISRILPKLELMTAEKLEIESLSGEELAEIVYRMRGDASYCIGILEGLSNFVKK